MCQSQNTAIRIHLAQQQARQRTALGNRKRVAIWGRAAAGRTLFAVEIAKSLASFGAKTLLLCYDGGLSDHPKVVTEAHPNLHNETFHQLCEWRIRVTRSEHGCDLLSEAIQAYPNKDH